MTNSDSFGVNLNFGIRQICEKSLHIPHEKAYCVYTFRHTWTIVASNECGASIDEVGFAMNHSDRSYLTHNVKICLDYWCLRTLLYLCINYMYIIKRKYYGIRNKKHTCIDR